LNLAERVRKLPGMAELLPALRGLPPAYLVGGAVRDMLRGAGEILLTSMDRDGTNDGYDLELTRTIAEAVGVPVIASGGAGELDHLAEALEAGADAALAASIFHFGRFSIAQAKEHLVAAGLPVRQS